MNIVFDFGAVLFRWQPALLVQQHLPQHAPTAQAGQELARALFGHDDWFAFDAGRLDRADLVARTAQRLGLDHDALHGMVLAIADHLTPLPDTVAVLDELRRLRAAGAPLRLYYLSNMPAPYARTLQERHAFLGWFDGGLFSADVGVAKPQPEIFERLAHQHGLAPGRTLFIDDMPANVEAARTLGWHGVVFESAAGLRQQLARHIDWA